jgi:predicted AAA+ superfamily ATPase
MYRRTLTLLKSQSFFLFGPRGSGKSTWLRDQFEATDCLWIDLLNQRTEFELNKDPDQLLDLWTAQGKKKWIIIDEVQKIPRLLDVVHRGIETHRIHFALTGSSSRKLKRGGANLLGGRAASRELYPFSSVELATHFDLNRSLSVGLLPRLWTQSELNTNDKVDALFSYVQTYLKEEVAAEQLVRNLDPFRRFLSAAAQCNAHIINQSHIERDSGVAQRQVARHYEILVDTLIGSYLEPFHQSVRKRQTAKSKFYFFDTGVVRTLKGVVSEPLSAANYEYGNLFETFLINEFIKINSSLNLHWQFSYLRTKDDLEVDLIIEKPRGKPILIEIKSTAKIKHEDLNSLVKIKKDLNHEQAYLLSQDEIEKEIDGIRCIPWNKGLREIFGL